MAIGPGSVIQSTENPKPLLWNATDNDVIDVFNPLSEDFMAKVAVDKPVNQPFDIRKTQGLENASSTEGDVNRNYGISLKNPDHLSAAHISTQVLLKAGITTSLLGGVAKVAVTQLVDEIMQREGDKLKLADPTARNEVERRVIKGNRSVQSLMSNDFQTERQQVQTVINNLNQGTEDEQQPAPTEAGRGTPEEDRSLQTKAPEPQRRSPGRPKKNVS